MIWMDWLIILSVVVLVIYLFVQWLPYWRQRLINNLGRPATELHMVGASSAAASAPGPLEEQGEEATKQLDSSGADAAHRYRQKFQQMAQGASETDAPLWKSVTDLAFAPQPEVARGLEHLQSVSKLSAQIAAQMKLPEAEVEEIRVAGIVHDIGKTHVPEALQLKPRPLTAAEFEVMKSHASWGAWMLKPLQEEGLVRIVRHHHERFDGRGYPDRLQGEDIPLGARILAVAECFDTMVSTQVYKAARSFDDAVAEICRGSSTQFVPRVVMAFLEQVQSHGDLSTVH